MPFQLVVLQGGRSNTPAVKIGAGLTTVGRQEDCQFRIASSLVSRKHCQLSEQDGKLIIKDLGSSNGTLVNGKKVEGQQTLAAGDKLTIGPVTFRVEATSGSAVAAAALPAAKAGDTAIAEPVVEAEAVDEGDVFEIAIDDESPTQAVSAPSKAPADLPAPAPEIGEDAVADFLLNIDLDDDDKP